MKKAKTLIVTTLAALVMVGCASFTTNLYNTENLAADTGKAAVNAFNQYYKGATNGASTNQLAQLNTDRDAVYDASRKLGASLQLLNSYRIAYAANASTANQSGAQTALITVSQQSSNLVNLITIITRK